MTSGLDKMVSEAARRRARAQSGASVPSEVALALAERKATAEQIVEAAAEAERLARVCESLRQDVARFEQRIATFRTIGKGRIEKKIEEYDPRFGIVLAYEPLRSVKTGDQLADEAQRNLDELQAALEANEAKIAELLAE